MAFIPKYIRWIVFLLLLLSVASIISLYAYGVFAKRAKGDASYTQLENAFKTPLEVSIQPLLEAHPGLSGLFIVPENIDAFSLRALSARFAGRSLDLQYYLWHDDLTGNLLMNEVLRAADRGVKVRILLDDINNHGAEDKISTLNDHPMIEIRMFNPSRSRGHSIGRAIDLLLQGWRLNKRMHNKAWIVDGRYALVGGRNIGDEYFDAAQKTNFLDLDLALMGPAVGEASSIFDRFWNSDAVIPIQELNRNKKISLDDLRKTLQETLLSSEALPYLEHVRRSPSVDKILSGTLPTYWTDKVHVYSDPPEKVYGENKEEWLIHHLLDFQNHFDQEIFLVSPYFVPGESGLEILKGLTRKGISVSVLTNSLSSTDVFAVHSGYAKYRKDLLRNGVNLYELIALSPHQTHVFGSSSASLHTKAFFDEGKKAFVGSFNLDPRSTYFNTEMGVMFEQEELVRELRNRYLAKITGQYSYRLFLKEDDLYWEDARKTPPLNYSHDPESSTWQRMLVKIISWLPIEKQL